MDSFSWDHDQEIRDCSSLGSLSSEASTLAVEEASRNSSDTFTVNLLPATKARSFLPPIDSDLVSSSSAVKRIRKISKVRKQHTALASPSQVSNKDKSRKQQHDLAEAVIKGDLEKFEEIVEVELK